MAKVAKPRVIGFNHVALEVGNIDEALAFYGRLFRFELRGKTKSMAFIDLGDQFIALQKGRRQPADDGRLWPRRGRQGSCPQGTEGSWCHPA
jgi:catechol 2,3-dioxygenase-like lactoylglutathione lyase family enzyme